MEWSWKLREGLWEEKTGINNGREDCFGVTRIVMVIGKQ
jgi:hypothetical protein